ncbi:putative holin [Pseudomonas sp. Irchel 3A5]|uniref:putative holin n=1 Tax=Pseudomonas sp. Irchel 3A5 TaxID=2008911 RepID=UPI000BA30B6F|nr:putative holin [Pseudomonas sp. Irchel 3A5]
MAEPASTAASVVVAGAAGAVFPGFWTGIDAVAAIGALAGALVFYTTTEKMPVWKRIVFLMVSFVMGYLFAPALVDFELWGIRPFKHSGPAAFGASVLVVTVALAAINRRGRLESGNQDG